MKFWGLVAICCLLCACSDDHAGNPEDDGHPSYSGMVYIAASGRKVDLGTDSPEASAKERPKAKVTFDYKYYISEHEVTQGEYKSLMGKRVQVTDTKDIGDSLPVINVTLYDAILYANARSALEGMDSAYSYSQLQFDSAGSCIHMESLVFHPEVKAYRLPTEAEWVFAASNGWNVSSSWTLDNSDGHLHEVCSLKKNTFRICDMEGNVAEWVNDWMGPLNNQVVAKNYLGAENGGAFNERLIKGGHIGKSSASIKVYSRGDVYVVNASNKFPYVGFRLALGAIPDGTWLSSAGKVKSSKLNVLLSVAALKAKTGTHNVKLAFRNEMTGNLAFIDFSSGGNVVDEIEDTLDVYHPAISPDGKWVAFCSKIEGVSEGKASSLFVRRLENDTSKVLQLQVDSAAIPRWRVLPNGDTVIVYVTGTRDNSERSAWLGESTWQVRFANGGFGTPEKLFNGSFNGGLSADGKLAVSGARILRARRGDSLFVWYDSLQACNASLQPRTGQTLFLDFGGRVGQDFAKEKYRTHERILVVDSTGRLIKSVRAPEGYAFDHTEWVTNNLAVATLVNLVGAHEKIVLVDMETSEILDLVSGDDLWHPDMHVSETRYVIPSEIESKLDPDSAAVYLLENSSVKTVVFREKMYLFWKYLDSINVVIFGSSRPSSGVNATLFGPDIFAINMSNIPNIMYESRYLFENYVVLHARKLKAIVVGLDLDRWYRSERTIEYNFFAEECLRYPGYVYDKNHDFWKSGYPVGMREYNEISYNPPKAIEEYTYNRGMQITPYMGTGWGAKPMFELDSNWMDLMSEDYYANFDNLVAMIRIARENDIKVLGVIFPQSPLYKKTGSFGRYGIRRSDAPRLIAEINALSEQYPNFRLLDENKMGNHDYPDSLAFDWDHLHNGGGVMITPRIDSALHSF